ncbi:MAG: KH domain-containing protein [Clostridia bacterium]|nr:KH domain-containing protein [Clostridia bacterium]
MKEVLEVIAKALVEHPDKVSVTEIAGDNSLTLELRVADGDMGKVIGKQGKIAKAIRTVVKAAASMENMHVSVDIVQ